MTAHSGNNFEGAFPFGNTALFRPLYVNFDHYTDGDHDFKRELGTQVIGNIQELKQSLREAIAENKPEIFVKVNHKIKLTLEMLNDTEFSNMITELEKELASHHHDGDFAERTRLFEEICQSLIRSLNVEIFGNAS